MRTIIRGILKFRNKFRRGFIPQLASSQLPFLIRYRTPEQILACQFYEIQIPIGQIGFDHANNLRRHIHFGPT
jgi:hypothetical protein